MTRENSTRPERGGRRRIPFMVSFVGPSDAGKTTLLCRLIRELRRRGLRVGAVKHSRSDFQIDTEGKDSFRLREAGASAVLLASPGEMALVADYDDSLAPHDLADKFFRGVDVVLVEGWKHSAIPKIVLGEKGETAAGLDNVIAAVGEKGTSADVPLFAPEEVEKLADFILLF